MRNIICFLLLAPCLFAGVTVRERLDYNGTVREFLVYTPASFNGSIILLFHGHAGDAKMFLDWPGFREYAEQDGVILVSVEGIPSPGGFWAQGVRSWNGAHCCGVAHEQDVDDVGFTSMLISYLRFAYHGERFYAIGHSNGGMLCHRLASELREQLLAVADISGCIGGQASREDVVHLPVRPDGPVSIIMVHDRWDPAVPFAETWETDTDGRLDIPFEDGVEFWRQACGYRFILSRSVDGAELRYYGTGRRAPALVALILPGVQHDCSNWPLALPEIWKFFCVCKLQEIGTSSGK